MVLCKESTLSGSIIPRIFENQRDPQIWKLFTTALREPSFIRAVFVRVEYWGGPKRAQSDMKLYDWPHSMARAPSSSQGPSEPWGDRPRPPWLRPCLGKYGYLYANTTERHWTEIKSSKTSSPRKFYQSYFRTHDSHFQNIPEDAEL